MVNREYMTVAQMGEMLGLKKTDSYWLIHKNLFETRKLAGKTLVVISSFEKWYENQVKYHKVCGTEPGLRLRKHSYSARDISVLLDVSEQTAYDLINRNGLKTILIDGRKRVSVEEFERWISSQTRYRLHNFSKREPKMQTTNSLQTTDDLQSLDNMRKQDTLQNLDNVQNSDTPQESDILQFPDNLQNTGRMVKSDHIQHRIIPSGYISPQQASALAGVSEQTIRHWAKMKHFSQKKVGNRIYIPENEFKNWLKIREEGGIADGSNHGKKRKV